MGGDALVRTDEDEQCAMYIRNLVEGRSPDPEAVRSLVLAGDQARQVRRPGPPLTSIPQDLEWALRVDAFDFAMLVERRNDLLVAHRLDR